MNNRENPIMNGSEPAMRIPHFLAGRKDFLPSDAHKDPSQAHLPDREFAAADTIGPETGHSSNMRKPLIRMREQQNIPVSSAENQPERYAEARGAEPHKTNTLVMANGSQIGIGNHTNSSDVKSVDTKKSHAMKSAGKTMAGKPALKELKRTGNPDGGSDTSGPKSEKNRRKNRLISFILAGVAVLCFGLGIYFLVLPSIVHKNQDEAAQQLLQKLKEQERIGHTGDVEITVKAGDVNAPGSFSAEYDVIYRPGESRNANPPVYSEEPVEQDAIITIKTDTIMRIPKIELEIAVAPNVRSSSLWVLPGHYPSSVQPGEKGVAAYFGHRMYGKGRHFNRLNEVEKGDQIIIQRKGKIYTYTVDANTIIDPADLGEYVFEETNKEKVLLITCHPIQMSGIPKYRIAVQGHLTKVEKVK